jgi:hypothetical protein
MMKLKLIACTVFMREAALCVAHSPHIIDLDFIELGRHAQPQLLHELLQKKIDDADSSEMKYDAILLLYGLCGNATNNVYARSVPLIIPRAHDCSTILLGSRKKYITHFAQNPSTPFSSTGYMERGEYFLRTGDLLEKGLSGDLYNEYVDTYGEENARYIMETMHNAKLNGLHPVFIDIPELKHLGYQEKFVKKMEAEGTCCKIVEGSLHLIKKLIMGEWDDENFLTVKPGQKIKALYDAEKVMTVV